MCFHLYCYVYTRELLSFPTRRSSDLIAGAGGKRLRPILLLLAARLAGARGERPVRLASVVELLQDRKSTRLNSSQANISYAVFCLKKPKNYKLIYDYN